MSNGEVAELRDIRCRLLPQPASILLSGEPFPASGFLPRIDGGTRCHRAVERFLSIAEAPATDGGIPLLIRCGSEEPGGSAYRLSVARHQVELTAPSIGGVVAGLETLLQLRDAEPHTLPSVIVDDRPRYSWRGLLLDCVRHWMPPEVVMRTLDGMAAVKLNVFHWHLTDDQGFRVESRRFPRLHEVGSGGEYYSQAEIRAIVEYAAERGIRVVPEFDLPGHCSSWLAAYPELGLEGRVPAVETRWGVFDSQLDVTSEQVYSFLDGFFAEMATLFPDPFVHIGGDEVPGRDWLAHPRVRDFLESRKLETSAQLQAYFTSRLARILARHDKRVAGWEEVAGADLTGSVVELYSGRPVSVTSGEVVVSTGFYLDHCQPAEFHYAQDPALLAPGVPPDRVIGGEACMWSEFVSALNVDTRLWPRLAAIAERFWSPASGQIDGSVYERLSVVNSRLASFGIDPVAATATMIARMGDELLQGPLSALAAVVEPVKEYARLEWATYSSATPLDRLVDAVPPESEAGRRFLALVKQCEDSPMAQRLVLESLQQWRALSLDPIFVSRLAADARLSELVPTVRSLGSLAEAGLSVIQHPPGELDFAALEASVERSAAPSAELLIAIAHGVRELVKAAQGH